MRRVLAALCVVGLVIAWTRAPLLFAHVRPAPFGQGPGRNVLSPHETAEATIDGASLSIDYGRPSMRGRPIFGALVPFDRIWCPGANACTKLTTNRDLKFGAFTLRAGAYTLWMLPSERTWTLTFNSQANAFHLGRNTSLDVGTIDLQKSALDTPVERLTFAFEDDPRGMGGLLTMAWETTRVIAPFTVVR